MPRPASWLPRLYDITRSVTNSVRSHYQRRDLELLFELQPRAAQKLLKMLPTTEVGTGHLVSRETLLSFLARVSTLGKLKDDQLTGFALRLVLTGHATIQNENEIDFLAEAEAAFVPPPPKKATSPSNAKKLTKTNAKALSKRTVKLATPAKSTAKKPTAKPAKA